MGFKYGMSFAVKDERELKEIKTKFERYNMNGSNKEHFIEIVDYFNFHRKDIEEKLRLEKAVIPIFKVKLITDVCIKVIDVINESFPKTMICGSKEYDINPNWFYRLKDFIKRYKIVEDIVYLNINKITEDVYITIENIKDEGDGEMSERSKKYVISIGYKNEDERNVDRDRFKAFATSPDELQPTTLNKLLSFSELFGVELVNDIDRSKQVREFLDENMIIKSNGVFSIDLVGQLEKYKKNLITFDYGWTSKDRFVNTSKDILEVTEHIAIGTYNKYNIDATEILEDILERSDFNIELNICGWNRGGTKSNFWSRGLDDTKTLNELIVDAHNHLITKKIHVPELRDIVESAVNRFILSNTVEAIKFHLGINKQLKINVVLNKEEKEYRGILGRLFNKKPGDVWIYKNDIDTIVYTEAI